MRTAEFDFQLPQDLIAQHPVPHRDQSRLLVFHRPDGRIDHRTFTDLPDYLRAGDVLVFNDSKVIPARLRGLNARTGGEFEVLLLTENSVNDWWTMMRPAKRARPDTRIVFKERSGQVSAITATVLDTNDEGHRRLQFAGTNDVREALPRLGVMPVPPYIARETGDDTTEDDSRYQTVFARAPGSVAAPTAGLHFTEAMLGRLRARGIELCFVTLHVGLGTFAPVKAENLSGHVMHEEWFEIGEDTARTVERARRERRRIVAVGTTSLRVLESVAAQKAGQVAAGTGRTRLFIHPPYAFQVADALLTNFHLPRSTLVMLASAFASPGGTRGRELLLEAYAAAVRERYRFFSYGDAMWIG